MPGGSVPPRAGARWVLLSSPGLRDGRGGRDRTPPVSSAVVTPSEGAGAAPQPAPQPAPSLLPPPAWPPSATPTSTRCPSPVGGRARGRRGGERFWGSGNWSRAQGHRRPGRLLGPSAEAALRLLSWKSLSAQAAINPAALPRGARVKRPSDPKCGRTAPGHGCAVCVCRGRGGPRAGVRRAFASRLCFWSWLCGAALNVGLGRRTDKGGGGRGPALAGGLQGGVGAECGCPRHAPSGPTTRCPSGEGRGFLPGTGWLHVSESNRSQKRMGNSELPSALKSNLLLLLRSVLIRSFLFPEMKFTFELGVRWENGIQ